MSGKIIIISAPSGAGKTTIVRNLLNISEFNLEFSISACSRPKRDSEVNGKDYYFFTPDEFRKKIKNNEFLEWEEVYKGMYYGSLKTEVERISRLGKNIIFDVDVKGGINIKKYYDRRALSIFIMPPSIEELEKRLLKRSTNTLSEIRTRIEKAMYEIGFADKFDMIIINAELNKSISEAKRALSNFLYRNE